MSDDDLVKELRWYNSNSDASKKMHRAADRIEKLTSALHQWDNLIRNQYNGSREAMSDMQDVAQITAALLYGDPPWPDTLDAIRRDAELSRLKDRIAKLEAALRKYANCVCKSNCDEKSGQVCQLWACRKALEGKDD